MNDAFFIAFALLLIVALIYDNRHHPEAWHDHEQED